MWLERIRLKRKLASADALIRMEAVSLLDCENDHALLWQLASADEDATVRSAAIRRWSDPEKLLVLRRSENDPQVLQLIASRIDQLYGEEALRACAEDRDCDAFDRIENNDTLINVALRSNSPALVLAAAARLASQPEVWRQLVAQLSDDRLALELYSRNMPDPESELASALLASARSQALREAIAQERMRRQAMAQAYAEELALVEAAELCAENADEEQFNALTERWRNLAVYHEELKNRFLAARYRLLRAREAAAIRREAEIRERRTAAELTAQLESLRDSGNWKLIRQVIENWNRGNLNSAAGAAEYRDKFNALAGELSLRAQALQSSYNNAMACAQKVFQAYNDMLKLPEVPALEVRQALLDELEHASGELAEVPVAFAEMRAAILNGERELRRRARAQAQERDLARWEHYTLKMDICSELEKLSTVPDEELFDAARAFRALRERWNNTGAVPNEKFEELRTRYRNGCAALHCRLEKFFAEREASQQEALAKKQAILAEAETLSGSEDWSETSARLKELQNLWKLAGSAGSQHDRELFDRFHTACDAFFVRRNTVWEERKKGYQEAAGRKQELCLRAEGLKELPFAAAKQEVAKLREEWRNIPTAGKDDRLLYVQFNRAIENIFAAHREAGDEARRRAEILCTGLNEILEQANGGSAAVQDIERMQQENQRQWDELDFNVAGDVVRRRRRIADELQKVICRMYHQEAMHKLESAEQLEAVIDPGDDNEKLLDHLGRRLKVCGELEERLRECRIIAGGGDLAGELQQAFAGNFGGDDYKLTVAELDEFLQRFVAVGQVPPDAREAVFSQFRTLYDRALEELKQREAAENESSPAVE